MIVDSSLRLVGNYAVYDRLVDKDVLVVWSNNSSDSFVLHGDYSNRQNLRGFFDDIDVSIMDIAVIDFLAVIVLWDVEVGS